MSIISPSNIARSEVLSYLVQVYSGLRERNALALTIDLLTGGTGDAAHMLARLGPDGDFSDATAEVGNLVRPLSCANLGPVLLLVSKRRTHPFVAALLDWRLFENGSRSGARHQQGALQGRFGKPAGKTQSHSRA